MGRLQVSILNACWIILREHSLCGVIVLIVIVVLIETISFSYTQYFIYIQNIKFP